DEFPGVPPRPPFPAMARSTKRLARPPRLPPSWSGTCMAHSGEVEVIVTHSKTGRADVAPAPEVVPLPPTPARGEPEPPAPPAPADGFEEPRALGAVLDDALERMERRAGGDERPVPLPWSNVASALGGGLWGGTLVTLVGDTGSGKT